MFGKIGLNDSLSKLCDVSRVLDSRPDWIEVFMRVMLEAMKRADWTDCQACTCIILIGRPDRGIMPLRTSICFALAFLGEADCHRVWHFERRVVKNDDNLTV